MEPVLVNALFTDTFASRSRAKILEIPKCGLPSMVRLWSQSNFKSALHPLEANWATTGGLFPGKVD